MSTSFHLLEWCHTLFSDMLSSLKSSGSNKLTRYRSLPIDVLSCFPKEHWIFLVNTTEAESFSPYFDHLHILSLTQGRKPPAGSLPVQNYNSLHCWYVTFISWLTTSVRHLSFISYWQAQQDATPPFHTVSNLTFNNSKIIQIWKKTTSDLNRIMMI